MCTGLDLYEKGLATYVNPETGMRELCYHCHRTKYPHMHTKINVRKEIFILGEIQRQIPELESYFLVWDCPLPLQDCTKNKPDMAWKVNDTLIHVEVDENGKGHEDDMERIVGIHAASNASNHILIRFNPDKTSEGYEPCLKRTVLKNGDNAYIRHLPEWERRIPVLIESVKNALKEALENVNVTTGKRKLFF